MIAMQEESKGGGRNSSAGVAGCGEPEVVRRIEQSVVFMAQHLDRPLQVATLAAQANISPSHFFALFKRRIGSAPMDYFTRLRMQRACRLLEDTSLSVKEIASKLGYHDPFYFSRVFKSVNNLAPSDYRAALRRCPLDVIGGGGVSEFSTESQTTNLNRRVQFA
jgi:transcriptional regulator GlxA family with amidase domain